MSVIIPAHNAEKWLSPTLKSACNQTLREIEILVIDDGSHDHTASIVRKHSALDPRICLIQRENGGVGAARNTGIRHAHGKYIAPLDADDLWSPKKLEAQVTRMDAGGDEMGLVYCWSEKIDARGKRLTASFPFEIEGWVIRSLILRNFIGSGSVPLFRTAALEKTGLYLERAEQGGVQGCEDWDLSLRLAERFTVGLVPRALVGYRQVASCMSLDAAMMSRSYEIVMDRTKARNPALPRNVFRWSAGNFYSYLVSKCYLWGEYRGCLHSIAKAVTSDAMLVANRRFYLMGLKSMVRLMTATRGRPPVAVKGRPVPAYSTSTRTKRTSWAESIQLRRWQAALAQDWRAHRT